MSETAPNITVHHEMHDDYVQKVSEATRAVGNGHPEGWAHTVSGRIDRVQATDGNTEYYQEYANKSIKSPFIKYSSPNSSFVEESFTQQRTQELSPGVVSETRVVNDIAMGTIDASREITKTNPDGSIEKRSVKVNPQRMGTAALRLATIYGKRRHAATTDEAKVA